MKILIFSTLIIISSVLYADGKMYKDEKGRWVNSKGGNIYGDSRFNLDADTRYNPNADPRFNLDADPRFSIDSHERYQK